MRLVLWVIIVVVLPLTCYVTLGNKIILFGPPSKMVRSLSTLTFCVFMKLTTITVMGLPPNTAPWHIQYFKLKELEKTAEAGRYL